MTFFLLFCLFILFFLIVNLAMKKFGLFALVAKTYSTSHNLKNKSLRNRLSISLSAEIDGETEYRHWLVVESDNAGVLLAETHFLNFFPLKMYIPSEKIKLIKQAKGILKRKFIYRISLGNRQVFMSSPKELFNDNNIEDSSDTCI